jgi:cytochrome oxidase assembly protein ShyY1
VYRFLLAPRWLALHVAIVAMVVGFVALGWWQLEVYGDSDARLATRELPAVPVAEVAIPGQPLGGAADRAVIVDGNYVADLVVPGRVHERTLGAYAAGVLETPDGRLLVLRGWQRDPEEIAALPTDPVMVSGHLVTPEVPGEATGGSPLPTSRIGYLAPAAAAASTGFPEPSFYAGYLVVTWEQPEPLGAPERLDVDTVAPVRDVSPWQNLSYWAQWWVFAGAVVIFWASAVRSGVRKRRAPGEPDLDVPAEPDPPPSAQRRTTSAG